ncbi:hypothetical protein [Gilliamella sp. WF3-4]|jgi:hypothetical protein|uniref:hypothetical protein n=1 Tax=Gilliamella sp. WF3-4 TaxID=3120255 RepID=UPI00159EF3C6|nr:hypothetical protein [Gilliamella apicola]
MTEHQIVTILKVAEPLKVAETGMILAKNDKCHLYDITNNHKGHIMVKKFSAEFK